MGKAVSITRTEQSAPELRSQAARCDDAEQARRLLALAMVLDGASRDDAARMTGMDRQTLRDWVHRYNAEGIEGLRSRKAPGPSPKLTEEQRGELRQLVVDGPDPKVHKVIRWRCVDLRDEVLRRFDVAVDQRTVAKWLRKMEMTRLQPRPFHPKKDAEAQEAFKKTSVHF
jgi:transposase